MNQLAQQQQALLTSSCDVPSKNVYKIVSHSLCVIVPFLCSSGISDSGHQTPVRHLHLINLVRHKTQLVPVPKWYDKCIARPWEQFHHLSKIKNLFVFFSDHFTATGERDIDCIFYGSRTCFFVKHSPTNRDLAILGFMRPAYITHICVPHFARPACVHIFLFSYIRTWTYYSKSVQLCQRLSSSHMCSN